MATVDNSVKISALPGATPPLAANDAVAVVQGGVTKQVPIYAASSDRVRAIIVTGINLNGTGDRAVVGLSSILSTGSGAAKYRITAAYIYEASTTLAGTTAATLSLRTAAAGGGLTLFTALTAVDLQALTAAAKILTTVPIVTDYFVVPTLYVNLTTQAAAAVTVSMYIQLTELV